MIFYLEYMLYIALFSIFCCLTVRVEGNSQAQVEGLIDACRQTVDEAVLIMSGHWQV